MMSLLHMLTKRTEEWHSIHNLFLSQHMSKPISPVFNSYVQSGDPVALSVHPSCTTSRAEMCCGAVLSNKGMSNNGETAPARDMRR